MAGKRNETIHQRYIVEFEGVANSLEQAIERSRKHMANLTFDKNTEKHFHSTFNSLEKDLQSLRQQFGKGIITPSDEAALQKKLSAIMTSWNNFGNELARKGFKAEDVFLKNEEFTKITNALDKLKQKAKNTAKEIRENTRVGANIDLTQERKEKARRAAAKGSESLKQYTDEEVKVLTGKGSDYAKAKRAQSSLEKKTGKQFSTQEAIDFLEKEVTINQEIAKQNSNYDESLQKIQAMNEALERQEQLIIDIENKQNEEKGNRKTKKDIDNKYKNFVGDSTEEKIVQELNNLPAKRATNVTALKKAKQNLHSRNESTRNAVIDQYKNKEGYEFKDVAELEALLDKNITKEEQAATNNKRRQELEADLKTVRQIKKTEEELAALRAKKKVDDKSIKKGTEVVDKYNAENNTNLNASEVTQALTKAKEHNLELSEKERLSQEQTLKLLKEKLKIEKQVANIQGYSEELEGEAKKIDDINIDIDEAEIRELEYINKASKDAGIALDGLENEARQINQPIKDAAESMSRYGREVESASKKTQAITSMTNYIKRFVSATVILQKLRQVVMGAWNDFRELDKQFNEISIVTGKTMEELWQSFDRLNYVAQQYGVVTSDVVATQKLYYQQGRSAAEVTQLTASTLTMAKISSMNFSDATEYMTAAINAYNISAADAIKVTDTYSALSTAAAVDANEVAVAMSKVASLAAMSGATFEDASAYLAKIIETTREAPETAGTALKTIIARFTAVNKLTEDQKELLGEDYNFNNLEKALRMVGISMKDSSGQMKDFSEILDDLGPKWKKLDNNTKHYIATQAAGARQQSRFIALMDDWERTQELITVAENSAGTGAEQLALAMEGIEAKLNKLKASWQEFYTKFLDSSVFKGIVDAASNLLKILTDIANIPVIGPTLIIGLTAAMIVAIKMAATWGEEYAKAFVRGEKIGRKRARNKDKAKEKVENTKDGTTSGKTYEEARHKSRIFVKRKYDKAEDAAEVKEAAEDGIRDEKIYQSYRYRGSLKPNRNTGRIYDKVPGGVNNTGDNSKKGGFVPWIMSPFDDLKKFRASKTWSKASNFVGGKIGKVTSKLTGTKLFKNVAGDGLKFATEGSIKVASKGLGQATKTMAQGLGKVIGKWIPKCITKALPVVSKVATKFIPYVGWALIIVDIIMAVFTGAFKLIEVQRKWTEKKILQTTQSIQQKISKAMDKLTSSTEAYNKALALHEKGLWRLTEEEEEYQSSLETLKETYPELVKTLADGTLELVGGAQGRMAAILQKERDTIKGYYDEIDSLLDNRAAAASSGVTFSDEGKAIQESIKESTSMLTTFDDSILREGLGLSGLNTKNLTKMQETGLNRQSLNAAVNEHAVWYSFWLGGGDFDLSQDAYLALLERLAEGENLSGDVWYGQEYDLIKYYAEQMGMTVKEMAQQLIYEADGTSKAIIETTTMAQTYALENGLAFTTHAMTAIDRMIKDSTSGKTAEEKQEDAERAAKEYYSYNSSSTIDNIESYVDDIGSDLKIGDKIKSGIDFGIIGTNAQNFVQEMINQAKEDRDNMLYGEGGMWETYAAITGQTGLLDKDEFATHFKDFTIDQIAHIIPLMTKVSAVSGFEAAKAFEESYTDYIDKIGYNSELMSEFVNVDTNDVAQVSAYAANMAIRFGETSDEYQGFVDLVNNSSPILERNFRTVGQVIAGTKTEIQNMASSIESLGKAVSGTLTPEELLGLMEQYGDYFDLSQFEATSEGLKLIDEEGLNEAKQLQEDILNIQRLQLKYEADMYRLRIDGLKAKMMSEAPTITETDINRFSELNALKMQDKLTPKQQEEFAGLFKRINEAGQTDNLWTILESEKVIKLAEEMDVIYEQVYINTMKANSETAKTVKQLEKLIELLGKIEEYADIDNYIQNLETELSHYEFEIEFSANIDNVIDSTKAQLDTLNNLHNASLSKQLRAEQNAAARRKQLEENFGEAVSFDEAGNLLTNDDWIRAEMERISKLTGDDQEAAQRTLESKMQLIEAYREEFALAKKSRNEAEEYYKQVEEVTTGLRENVVSLEDKFRELFIQRDEDALESLKERYDAMKKMDEDYLNSVREAIEEERRLRDRTNEEEDLAKMQRQLELMRMSGGSATEIQSLEKEIEQKTQNMADARMDDFIDEIEKQYELRAAEMDEEVLYQEQVLETKKENQILYNQEIAELMKKDKETIMNTWRSLDKEFQTATSENKILLESEMNQMVISGKSASELLADNYIKKIEDAYTKVKEAIDIDKTTMIEYANTVSEQSNGAILSLQTLGDKYYNVADSIDAAWEAQNRLNKALKEYASLKIDVPNEDGLFDEGNKYSNQKQISNSWYNRFGNNRQWWYQDTQGNMYKFDSSTMQIRGNTLIGKNGSNLVPTSGLEAGMAKLAMVNQKGLINNNNIQKGSIDWGGKNITYDDIKNVAFSLYNNESDAKSGPEKTKANTKVNAQDIYNPPGLDTWQITGLSNDGQAIQLTKRTYTGGGFLNIEYWANTKDFLKWFAPEGINQYATGGMVDYTGPAWVDGTPSKPEAFLSANDTSLIASLRDVLRVNGPYGLLKAQPVQKAGDTYYEIHINVDELGDGYSVDDLMNELEDRIVQSADKNTVIKISR